jgi:hypothetical protein
MENRFIQHSKKREKENASREDKNSEAMLLTEWISVTTRGIGECEEREYIYIYRCGTCLRIGGELAIFGVR